MMNRTEELDKHLNKRVSELIERGEHKVSAMHTAIKSCDAHLNSMHSGNHKFQVKSFRQVGDELK